jgi:microcystin-dependent protein
MTNVVERFLHEPGSDRRVTQMTIDEAEHYTPEQRARIVASYAPHEREARARGMPMLGSGRVFPVPEETLATDAFAIPAHWPQIGGLDFGWDHPFAAVKLAWDRDADCVYVTSTCRMREATPVMLAASLKPWGEWLPWAWPHEGLQHSKDSGKPLADQYRNHGLKLLPEHARFAPHQDGSPGSSGVEAGLMEMLDRMQSGRLRVFHGRIQGRYASTGSSNAYVLAPDVALAAYVTGERYSFRANFANTGAATLNISSLGAKSIRKMTLSGKISLGAGDIQPGQPVTVEYDGTDMVLITPAATTSFDATPIGTIAGYAGATAPNGWLLCDGAAVSRTTFAALFAVVATSYGTGDGSTTFNLPDLRGRVGVGKDDMGGIAANRSQVSTTISTTNGSSNATVASAANLAIGMTIVSANVSCSSHDHRDQRHDDHTLGECHGDGERHLCTLFAFVRRAIARRERWLIGPCARDRADAGAHAYLQ